jgi:hypothetical protein
MNPAMDSAGIQMTVKCSAGIRMTVSYSAGIQKTVNRTASFDFFSHEFAGMESSPNSLHAGFI